MSDDESRKKLIEQFKANLSEREMKVLKDRFGVDFLEGTDEEVLAAMLEITQEKIEKIEWKALKKLRGNGE